MDIRYRIPKAIYMSKRRVKWFFQKNFSWYRVSDDETYDICSSIVRKYLPVLWRFRELNDAYPCIFIESAEEYHCSEEEFNKKVNEGKIIKGGEKEWDAILDKIIFSFLAHIYFDFGEETKLEKKLIKELIVDVHGDVRKCIVKLSKEYENEEEMRDKYQELSVAMQEGFELFGKYLCYLWW